MNWYVRQRRAWIEEMLFIFGFVNRRHVMGKFGCSAQTASKDLTEVSKKNRAWVAYDPRVKAYINTGFPPRLMSTADAGDDDSSAGNASDA